MSDTIILFAHGARDPRWADPLRAIAEDIALLSPSAAVELAFLEFMEPSLYDLASRLVAAGVQNARLVPVFLGGAGHVLRDLPGLVEACRTRYPKLEIKVQRSVGQSPEVIRAIARVAIDSRD
jgi:sirohydrochlorin cobaltochelatase